MVKYATATPYIACYLLVRNDKNEVAFVLRSNTSWMDGHYGLPAGKVENDESYIQGAIREGKEEIGVDISPSALRHVLTVHRREDDDAPTWVDVYFEVAEYSGEVVNAEPHVHSEVAWFDLEDLPENTIPSLRYCLEQIVAGNSYAEYGWDGGSEDRPALG